MYKEMMVATSAEIEKQLLTHEAVCAERYNTFITRVDRLEKIMLNAAAALILGMAGILATIIMKGA
jgi:hypothetical protein